MGVYPNLPLVGDQKRVGRSFVQHKRPTSSEIGAASTHLPRCPISDEYRRQALRLSLSFINDRLICECLSLEFDIHLMTLVVQQKFIFTDKSAIGIGQECFDKNMIHLIKFNKIKYLNGSYKCHCII